MNTRLQGQRAGWGEPLRKRESTAQKWARRARQLVPKFLRRERGVRRQAEPRRVDQLTQKLWGGHSVYSIEALRSLMEDASADRQERIEAALQLARWRAAAGEHREALQLIGKMRELSEASELPRTARLMEVDLNLRLGEVKRAQELVAQAVRADGYDTDFSLLAANVASGGGDAGPEIADKLRLDHINRIYAAHGFLRLRQIDEGRPLSIDNIACEEAPQGETPAEFKISIIMPTHNAAGTIEFALRGAAAQTWRNLEILVVDDGSSDRSREIVERLAAADPRIRLIAVGENLGAYNARNRGLAQATGEYVTVHDADDWSHAQKLEAQIAYIRQSGTLGCFSHWARVQPDLYFGSSWRPSDKLCHKNFSSLLLPTRIAREFGGWDPVRAGADQEFAERLAAKFGAKQFPVILKAVPLSFALSQEGSLTRNAATHVRTYNFGMRKDYRFAFTRWHRAAAESGNFAIDPDPRAARKFPAPATILGVKPDEAPFDTIFIGDFAESGASLDFALASIRCGLDFGRRIGIFHWPRAEWEVARDIAPAVAALVDDFRIELIEAGRQVAARQVTVFDAASIRDPVDAVPDIRFEKFSVVDLSHDPDSSARSTGNLKRLFGTAGERVSRGTLSIYSESMLEALRAAADPGDAMSALRARLVHEADAALTRGPYSVTDKPAPGPSGDVHDYWTTGPYWWPNPKSADGLPYTHRDGDRYPGTMLYAAGSERYDRTRLQRLVDDTTVLALGAFASGRREYAQHAASLVRRWFVDPASRMTPRLAFAQMVPGRKAAARGIIEAKDFYFLIDALLLLERVGALDEGDVKAVSMWFSEYLNWLLNSDLGAAEREAQNNHGTYYDLQVAAIASYVGDFPELFRALSRARTRIHGQFARDGSQPHERRRSIPLHYHCFNLMGWIHLAAIGERWGQDLWRYETEDGRSVGQALRWLTENFHAPIWPEQEVARFTSDRFWPIYYACRSHYGPSALKREYTPPEDLAVEPVFHPFDGMEPFWMLGRAFGPSGQVSR